MVKLGLQEKPDAIILPTLKKKTIILRVNDWG